MQTSYYKKQLVQKKYLKLVYSKFYYSVRFVLHGYNG